MPRTYIINFHRKIVPNMPECSRFCSSNALLLLLLLFRFLFTALCSLLQQCIKIPFCIHFSCLRFVKNYTIIILVRKKNHFHKAENFPSARVFLYARSIRITWITKGVATQLPDNIKWRPTMQGQRKRNVSGWQGSQSRDLKKPTKQKGSNGYSVRIVRNWWTNSMIVLCKELHW